MTSTPRPPEAAPILDHLRSSLRILYDDLARDIAAAGPACELSGRCCRFAEYGHTLFLSGVEAKILVADAPEPVRTLDDGSTCPWQDLAGRCTAREARPFGCRVYFCDETYQDTSHTLSEAYIGRLKHLSDAAGEPWDYAPLHHHLRRLLRDADGPGVPRESPAEAPPR